MEKISINVFQYSFNTELKDLEELNCQKHYSITTEKKIPSQNKYMYLKR